MAKGEDFLFKFLHVLKMFGSKEMFKNINILNIFLN